MKQIKGTLRRTSIKHRLKYLFFILLITVLLLFFTITYNLFITMKHQIRSSGQQLLLSSALQMSDILSEIVTLTRYPALANAYGDTLIYRYLSESIDGHRGSDHMELQYELSTQLMLHPSVSLMAIADLSGNLLYCDDNNAYYQLAKYDANHPLYQPILDRCGGYQIISSEEMDAFAPSVHTDGNCLYGARAIMTLYPFEAIGIVFCQINTEDIRTFFESNRLYPEQMLSLWNHQGQLLYGDAIAQIHTSGEKLNRVESYWLNEDGQFYLYQIYQTNDGVTAVLRTPLSCILRNMGLYLSVLFALLLILPIIVLIFSRILLRSIRENIDKLIIVCKRIQNHDFSPLEDDESYDEMHELIESFNVMCANIRHLIEVVYEKNLLQAQTEMQLVRSQINPHFVYNTLEVIRATSHSRGQNDIAQMTTLLGKTLRYGITRQTDSVTVEQEMVHLQDYIVLQQMHLQHRMKIYINVDREIYGCYMLRLVLQPLVENAIHHGLPKDGRQGTIRILGFPDGENITFTISDDGVGIPKDRLIQLIDSIEGRNDAFSSIGLRNTHRRLILYYGKQYGLEIRSIPDQGTVVTVRMPRRTAPFTVDSKEMSHDSCIDC